MKDNKKITLVDKNKLMLDTKYKMVVSSQPRYRVETKIVFVMSRHKYKYRIHSDVVKSKHNVHLEFGKHIGKNDERFTKTRLCEIALNMLNNFSGNKDMTDIDPKKPRTWTCRVKKVGVKI